MAVNVRSIQREAETIRCFCVSLNTRITPMQIVRSCGRDGTASVLPECPTDPDRARLIFCQSTVERSGEAAGVISSTECSVPSGRARPALSMSVCAQGAR